MWHRFLLWLNKVFSWAVFAMLFKKRLEELVHIFPCPMTLLGLTQGSWNKVTASRRDRRVPRHEGQEEMSI
jgi:hypothetical protein